MTESAKTDARKNRALKEAALRTLARADFKTFFTLKWTRYKKMPFNDNWHIDYLCKILEATLPQNSACTQSLNDFGAAACSFTPSKIPAPPLEKHSNLAHNPRILPTDKDAQIQNLSSHTTTDKNTELAHREQHEILGFEMKNRGFGARGEEATLAVVPEAECEQSAICRSKPNLPITRLMINMPPSYGKTEIIARTFIAWALGRDRTRKFFYISYSDELCRKISNEVRALLKSKFWAQIFERSPIFIQDNVNEFVLQEGGGLFVTTLKSSLTGFHAHQILIDDPIKVADMNSKAERMRVNQNFKESVLSRLQDNNSNITILMQRLGDEDLCGFLTDPRHFSEETIAQWKIIKLQAINKEREVYEIGDFSYTRQAGEALFPARHSISDLENLKLAMGEDEFSTQYMQEPQVSEAGYFESGYFTTIPSFEQNEQNEYIFVDNAMSLNQASDNRALVVVGVENYKEAVRYVCKDCLYGIWSEEESIANLIELMQAYPKAKVYIESDGGGLTLARLLERELVQINTHLKSQNKPLIYNHYQTYTPSRKISKVEKIKAMRPYYNTGFLVFLHNARGLGQIQKELFGFNPAKPFRKDDCIDALASALSSSDVVPPPQAHTEYSPSRRSPQSYYSGVWRI